MADRTEQKAPVGQLSFEQALAELEEIVAKLEAGNVELEVSIGLYERGQALKTHCEALLQRAEAKVEKLVLDSSGAPTGTEALDVDR